MPHIPLYTQPTTATYNQLSSLPIISTQKQITAKAAKGIASLEYVFEPQYPSAEIAMREQVIREAEEWERENRQKRLAL
jgi:chromatin structure-remodeling complex protein RSC7